MSLIEASLFNGSDQERAEGARRVLRQLVRAIISEIGTEDDEHPVVFRATDRFLKTGLDNPDNHYLWARISGDAQYRVVGARGTTADFFVQVYRSMPGLPGWAGCYTTGGFFDANSLTTDFEGNFEILLGGEKRGSEHDAEALLLERRRRSNAGFVERALLPRGRRSVDRDHPPLEGALPGLPARKPVVRIARVRRATHQLYERAGARVE